MGEREIKAFALAPLPLVAPLLLAIAVNAVAGDTGDGGYAGVFFAMLAFALLSYVATLLIGIPIHLVLQHFRKTGLIHYLSLAVLPFLLLAGAIAVWLQLAPAPVPPVNPFGLYMNGGVAIKWTLVFAAIASLSATTFWYAGVRQPKP
ncbi:hypothetical protein [Sphingomonas alpina]|uniref:Uncharacterized protein n=1 Tax=Sphingomonas alpina TaxID=653931 RepID=A0A7H0LF87_9SPHN|nr:hypothetical protein [Sphingomonas alpina]QNQ08340.1 hypothetical protein H3Z74_16505 [Sphingomonas alpina]